MEKRKTLRLKGRGVFVVRGRGFFGFAQNDRKNAQNDRKRRSFHEWEREVRPWTSEVLRNGTK